MRRSIDALVRHPAFARLSVITAGKVLASILQALTFALLARSLGVASYGEFAITYGIVLVFMSILEFGFGNRALRISGEEHPERLAASIVAIRSATNALVIIATVATVAVIGFQSAYAAGAIALYTSGELFATLAQTMLIGFFREKAATVALICRRIVTLALMGALVLFWGDATEQWTYLVLGLSGAIGYAVGLALLARHFDRPRPPVALIRENRVFWASSLSNNLQQADTLVIGMFGSTTLAGLYAAATRLTSPLNLLTGSILQSVVPAMSVEKQRHRRRSMFSKVLTVMGAYAGFLVLASLLAPFVVRILFGEEYAAAGPIAVAVVMVAAANAVIQALLSWYYATTLPPRVPVFLASWTVLGLLAVACGAVFDSPTVLAGGLVVSGLVALGLFASTFPWRDADADSR
ncbi:oligosaccharide flippase family protein [Demequina sp. NBRC 110054]|uniref:oligosaccharide flippase family protein n=1 Tax=Demequina sp. NBRC 110054 TaxID=1570343 RepID=UPI0009FC6B21|nr:oligosaccharide flippase family protein [Demequina sp. NBRC 110054]